VSRPAVFLDRDGTLVEDHGFLDALDRMRLYPWTADALRLVRRAGFAVVVITNQSGVGRGIFDEAFLDAVHAELDTRLARGGARIDAYYHCPHHPTEARDAYRQVCRCRKPGPGMIEAACRDLDLDPARSVMVGDRWIDVACGHAAGARSVLVRTGLGAREATAPPAGRGADAVADNLMEAVGWILRNCSN
jgi:D-glycero-D-manno-heptose 1,7-bisphosphate phosphatase